MMVLEKLLKFDRVFAMSMHWRGSLALVLMGTLSYAAIFENDFVNYDDGAYITENPHVLDGLKSQNVRWAFSTFHMGLWQPLTWLSLQFDATLFGSQAWGFHLSNLIWHLANGLFLYGVLGAMTDRWGLSWITAALFLVHPQHVESVAWATERKDVLSTFFWLLTMAAYVHYAHRPGMLTGLLVVLAFILGLGAKAMLVTLPFALLLLDVWPLRRWTLWQFSDDGKSGFEKSPGLFLILEKAPLFLLAAIGSLVAYVAQRDSGAVHSFDVLPLDQRLINGVVGYGQSLWHTVVPTNLAAFYPHPMDRWSVVDFLISAGALIGISAVAYLLRRQVPAFLIGWLWFIGTLVPVSGLVQVGTQAYADRFVYIPHIGLFFGLVWMMAWLLRERSVQFQLGVTAAVLVILSVLTFRQVQTWRDSPALWQHALEVIGDNHKAYCCLGIYAFEKKDPAKAEEFFQQALWADDRIFDNCFNLGTIRLLRGDFVNAQGPLERAVELGPQHFEAWQNLGTVFLQTGQVDRATQVLAQALARDVARTTAWVRDMAESSRRQDPRTLYALGWVLAAQRDFSQARTILDEGIPLARSDPALLRRFEDLLRLLSQAPNSN